MAATIQNTFHCPRCEEGITSINNTAECPACGLPLGTQNLAPYTPPYTFTEQHEKFKSTKAYVETLVSLPINKANSIMNDALSLIEIVAGKNTPTTDIRNIVKMAIKIGEIAKAYDEFLSAGGKHVPSFFTETAQTGESDVQSKKTGVTE